MYRITTYEGDNKDVEEIRDEDEMRDRVDDCLKDLESGAIRSFTVSRISESTYTPTKSFWEK